MLDEKDLQAMAQMMEAQEKRLDQKLSVMEQRIHEEMAQLKQDILAESTHNMKVLIENEVTPKFNLLAEGQQDILDKLVPRARVDDLEEEVKFLKSIVRQINEDLQQLKKAN